MDKKDLQKRLKSLAVKTGRLCIKLPFDPVNKVYIDQIIRSSTSSAANYRSAGRAKSKADFVNKLKIVEEELDETMKAAIAEKEKMIWTGFLAQEVEASAYETGFVFSGVDKPRNEHGVYGLRYAEFVAPLVKAVQELSAQGNALQKEISVLKSSAINTGNQQQKIETLTKRIERLEQLLFVKTN